jgi:hypothetical protein
MSRDLSFWKARKKGDQENEATYAALSNEEFLDFVDEIPVLQVQQDFDEVFKDWNNQNFNYEKGSESFQLMLTKQFVRVDCYGVTERNMNRIIDIMIKYNCPLYDSAINVRFDESL